MSYPFRKLIVVLLAIWLPLFTGNALAMSIVMQSPGKACHVKAAPQAVQHQQHAADHLHHHMDMTMSMSGDATADQQSAHFDEQGHGDKDCGICHLACCSYLAAVSSKLLSLPFVTSQFTLTSLQFQSISLTPLDPPPLARV